MHPYLGDWIRALVLLHLLAAFGFALAHGPSVAAMMRLRTERDLAKVQALLDMSRAWSGATWVSWAFLALTGTLLAATEHTWREPWVWGSVVVLILTTGAMSPLAARAFNEARHAAGSAWFDGKGMRAPEPPDRAALDAALATIRARSVPVLLLGVVGLALLVWLMVARPG